MQRMKFVCTLLVLSGLLNADLAAAKPSKSMLETRPTATVLSQRPSAQGTTHFFSMVLPQRARSPIDKLSFSFTKPNRNRDVAVLPFVLSQTQGFLGTPMAGGQSIPIKQTWIDETGTLWVEFARPLPPNTRLTIGLRTPALPSSTVVDYGIAAYPTARSSAALLVGTGTLSLKR
jgi:hypothetical protein